MTNAHVAIISGRVVVCVSGDTCINMHELTPEAAARFAGEILQAAIYVSLDLPTKATAGEFFEAMRE